MTSADTECSSIVYSRSQAESDLQVVLQAQTTAGTVPTTVTESFLAESTRLPPASGGAQTIIVMGSQIPSPDADASRRSWQFGGYKVVFYMLTMCYVLYVLRGFVQDAKDIGLAFYMVGNGLLKPLGMFSITGVTCTALGLGCRPGLEDAIARTQTPFAKDYILPEKLGQLASELDYEAVAASHIMGHVLSLSNGATLRLVREQQLSFYELSNELQFMSTLADREQHGAESRAVVYSLQAFGDSLVTLVVQGREFLAFFISEFIGLDQHLRDSLARGTESDYKQFDRDIAGFLCEFSLRLLEFQKVVTNAHTQGRLSLSTLNKLGVLVASALGRLHEQDVLTGNMLIILETLTAQGRARSHSRDTLLTTKDLTSETLGVLQAVGDSLSIMIQSATSMTNGLNKGFGSPFSNSTETLGRFRWRMSSLTQKRAELDQLLSNPPN